MATRRSSFEKRERDKNKKAKAAAKREKRTTKPDGEGDTDLDEAGTPTPVSAADQQAVFDALAILHSEYEDGRLVRGVGARGGHEVVFG